MWGPVHGLYRRLGRRTPLWLRDVEEANTIASDSYGFLRRPLFYMWRKYFYAPYHSLDATPLDYLKQMVERGELQPVLDSTYSMEAAEEAFQNTASQSTIGKTVINLTTR